ncbi:MAG: hypothetical protein ACJ8AD_01355 [Gemmatimonadaceae bacterium]
MARTPLEPTSPEVFVEHLKSIVATSVAENVQLATRVGALLVKTTATMAAAGPAQLMDPSASLARSLQLTLESAAIVNAHTAAMLNELVSLAERASAQPLATSAATPGPTASTAPTELQLESAPGERAVGRFAVDNQYDFPVQVTFGVSELAPAHGPSLTGTHVTLDPIQAVIGAKASVIVEVSIDVDEAFIAGETYSGTIRIVGFQAPDIVLRLSVLGPVEHSTLARRATKAVSVRPKKRGLR